LNHARLVKSPQNPRSLSKKKATGLSRGFRIIEQRPRAALAACPGPHFSSSDVLTEEGRPLCKVEEAKTKERNLLSSSDHIFHITSFLEKVKSS
jgi:hypothetical protein